ncbi:MAG: hypothetical protein V3U88_08940 [Methylococcales bacterium]
MLNKNKTIKLTFVAFCLIGLFLSYTPIAARLPHEISHLFSRHNHPDSDRFTRIGSEWPPQPKGRENVVWLQQSTTSQASRSINNTETIDSLLSTQDIPELGDRFTFVGTQSSPTQTSMNYFSHSNNSTVEVKVSQGEIESVEMIDPSEYQPPLTVEEVKEAVDIARTALFQNGFNNIQQLQGYGILAFKPASEINTGDHGFYDTRVAYISFHQDINARPEFIAWVDLTNRVVIKSQQDKL